MWPQIEQELSEILSSKPFPALLSVPSYRALLDARGKPNPAACARYASKLLSTSDLTSGIRELGGRERPRVTEWTGPLCRAVSTKNNPDGFWWFDEALVQRWGRHYPPGAMSRKQDILESIRPMLAVSFDWNDFTDLRLMRVTSAIPVITGQGMHKTTHAPPASPAIETAAERANREKVVFIGGYTQVFVPFVNPASTSLYTF